MKIAIIGPGYMSIPPKGWGAVESLIWDYSVELKGRGHDVLIVNTKNHREIINQVNGFAPDFVHLQYDDHIDVMSHIACPKKALTSHFGYLTTPQHRHGYEWIFTKFIQSGLPVFCLSNEIRDEYVKFGANPDKLFVLPNGADSDRFVFKPIGEKMNRSVYLGKIEPRKRQSQIQELDSSIDFVGNCIDASFNRNRPNYLGEYSKEQVKGGLTEYGNLLLLSDGEAHPLVCVEGMMAGLGLVVSEPASHNLDRNLPFISVVDEKTFQNHDALRTVIRRNREVSVTMREEIRKYALENFSWKVIVDRYLELIGKI